MPDTIENPRRERGRIARRAAPGLDPPPRGGISRPPSDSGIRARGLAIVAGLAMLVGCRSDMYDQPRYEPLEASDFFENGQSSRLPVPGTIPRGKSAIDVHLLTGKAGGKPVETFPFPIDAAALERGRDRYMIFCSPCHDAAGSGHGLIVQRGFAAPPSFHDDPRQKEPDRLRKEPIGHFFDVMTNGHGAMYSYASRIPAEDRWKIAAYIRAMQLSRHATIDDLKQIKDPTFDERQLLREAGNE